MKLSSVLNKFRKNGLDFEQVESGSAFYICKHELVENTYVQVLTKSNGTDVSTMAIVQKYDEQSESKTFFSTINGLLESFMLDVKNAEAKAAEKVEVIEELTIERERPTATQGYVKVFYKGVEIAFYGDKIEYIQIGEPYYGEMNSRWASVVPDNVFIDSVLKHPTKAFIQLLEKELENGDVEPAPDVEIKNVFNRHVNVFYKDNLITTIPFIKEKPDSFYYKIVQMLSAPVL